MDAKTNNAGARLRRATLLAAAVVLAGCGGGAQTPLDPAGPHAGRLNSLWWVFFSLLSAVYALVLVALVAAVYSGRSRPGAAARGAEVAAPNMRPGRERRTTNVVAGATILTTIILFALLVSSFRTGRSLTLSRYEPTAVTITVTGHQWWWEARYDDQVPSNIFTTANEIHIPVGVPVVLTLKSTDVIHSFWVPNLAGKRDLIPGKSSTLWLRADRAGTFRGQCAEYCGMQHAHMAFNVVAEPPEQFEAWRAAQRQPAQEPATDSQRRGREVFLSTTCVMCHTVQGTRANAVVGPNLTHVASRTQIAAGTLPNTRGHLAGWVVDSQSAKPGNSMPPNALGSEDLQALLDYLQSLR